jgi:TIR domain/Protein of unknown function (DUF3617)
MSDSRAPSVFISHHSSQVLLARQLKAKLEQAGITGWMAPDDIDPGLSFDQAIMAQVAKSDGIVLLFCGNSDQSRHVKRELILGEDSGKPIYPIRLENVTPKGLAYWLQDYQWIDWLGGKGGGADRLIETIRRNAQSGTAVPAPSVSAPAAAPAGAPGRRTLVVAGIALLLVLLAAGGWFLFGRGGTPPAAQPDFVVNPGKWIARRQVVAVLDPTGLSPERTRQIAQSFENDPDPEECIAPAVARAPDVRLFDSTGEGGCRLTSFRMAGGRISGYLSCPLRDAPGGQGVMTITLQGRYTRTLVELDNILTVSIPGTMMRLRVRDTTRYAGPTCSPQAAAPAGNTQ